MNKYEHAEVISSIFDIEVLDYLIGYELAKVSIAGSDVVDKADKKAAARMAEYFLGAKEVEEVIEFLQEEDDE